MNKLQGLITEVVTEGELSLVKTRIGNHIFSSIVVDTPKNAPYLNEGNEVYLLFKENEVVLATHFSGNISMQNKFFCTIVSIEMGKLLANIVLDFNGSRVCSMITALSANAMGLKIGDKVTAMVKTNEISLSQHG